MGSSILLLSSENHIHAYEESRRQLTEDPHPLPRIMLVFGHHVGEFYR
jgi:hypothetical protein